MTFYLLNTTSFAQHIQPVVLRTKNNEIVVRVGSISTFLLETTLSLEVETTLTRHEFDERYFSV